MNETLRIWVEIIFDLSYLLVVWGMVVLMARRMAEVAPANRKLARLICSAFALLALGDTGHVGFRVLAYAMGGLDARPLLLGTPVNLVGIGSLATAITVTFFYMLLVPIWQTRFHRSWDLPAVLLLLTGIVRLVILSLPGNNWGSVTPPQPLGLYRNLPLMIQGLGIMGLIFFDAQRHRDRTFLWIAGMIALSYAFYTPVILFSARIPLLGMLMIPKTCAYVAIAFIAYRALWPVKTPALAGAGAAQ